MTPFKYLILFSAILLWMELGAFCWWYLKRGEYADIEDFIMLFIFVTFAPFAAVLTIRYCKEDFSEALNFKVKIE